MKNVVLLLVFLSITSLGVAQSQGPVDPVLQETATQADAVADPNSFFITPRVGYDFPFFLNNTPYIDYKGGIDVGLSVDYYWKWIGVGFDFDYIMNKPKSTFPTENVYRAFGGGLITSTTLSEQKITRLFYGIGPDFKWQTKNRKFVAELNTRIGLGHIIGGRTLLTDDGTPGTSGFLNFHAGYDLNFKLATKLQTKFTYFVKDYLGITLGAYYLQHYFNKELSENGVSAAYASFTEEVESYQLDDAGPRLREEPCDCNIFSVGVFAGVTFRIPTKPKECLICETYSLAVTARDKFTKKTLPFTDVAIKNIQGEIVRTGTTNSYGVVVFHDIKPDNYAIEGLLHEVALDPSATRKDEFVKNETLQKEVIYSNEDFILEGNAVVCNTTEGIPGVKVKLINKAEGVQKNALTDDEGVYILHVKKNKTYSLSGKKDKYFSQTEIINTGDFDRNTTLFIKLEICMEKADCGKALALKNIHYDLDKYFIRNDAKPELNRLVEFMVDNPTIDVEVSSHTDSRSSHAYNETLSQNRASAAVDYLVSQGVERERLSGVGYGETVLLNECADGVECSEKKHQINRRTEMKVICPD
jgi:outer membrane protein OmpA-like peptidoglycan-associated protein